MSTTGKVRVPRACRECSRWEEMKKRLRITEILAKAVKAIEERLETKDFKPTVGDYLKLLQMEQEMNEGAAKEVKVTWVEPAEFETER
jgi:hypothetical protein